MRRANPIYDVVCCRGERFFALTVSEIKLLQAMKHIALRPETPSVETILEMTASSAGSWAEAALEERADRL
jgi:hypothetical protein